MILATPSITNGYCLCILSKKISRMLLLKLTICKSRRLHRLKLLSAIKQKSILDKLQLEQEALNKLTF